MFLIKKNQSLNKKADTSSKVIVAVVISVIAFVILILIIRNNPNTKEAQENAICQDSVLMAHMAQLTGQSFTSQIKCPYRSIVIKDKNEEKIKEVFAESMITCWKNFHQGKYKFSSDTVERYCFPCYHISFDENVFKEEFKTEGFIEYLSENNPKEESVSYLSFLGIEDTALKDYNVEIHEENEQILLTEKGSQPNDWSKISSNNEYLILYSENKQLDLLVFMQQMGIGATGGAAVGAFAAGGSIVLSFLLGSNPIGWGIVGTGAIIGGVAGPTVLSNIPLLGWEKTQRFPGIIIVGYAKDNEDKTISELSKSGCNIEGKFSDMR